MPIILSKKGEGGESGRGLPLGLTGATAATRYVGGTTSGPPTTGTFVAGDFVISLDGYTYICSVAGSPGTWVVGQSGATLWSPAHAHTFDQTLTADSIYVAGVYIPTRCTLTGIGVDKGGVSAGNLLVAIYDIAGTTRLATSSSTASAGEYVIQHVPFTSALTVSPGLYYLGIVPSSGTQVFVTSAMFGYAGSAAVGSFTTPATVTPYTAVQSIYTPMLTTY